MTVEVPCVDCGNPVKASWQALPSEDGTSARDRADQMLATRGEPPLRDDEVAKCRGCYAVKREQDSTARAADFDLARDVFALLVDDRAVPAYRVDALLKGEHAEMIRNGLAIAAERAKRPKSKRESKPYTGGAFDEERGS